MQTRGIRNNNPGNIRVRDPWQGLMKREDMNAVQRAETEFCVFAEPKWGIRALARILIKYQDDYALHSVSEIIARYAPPTENHTPAYVRAVAKELGVDPDDPVNVHEFPIMVALVKAIIHHENGSQPYSDAEIVEGLKLAGVAAPLKPITQSKTLGGAIPSVVGGATAAGGVLSALGALSPLAQAIIGAGLTVALLGGCWVVWNRLQERKRGER